MPRAAGFAFAALLLALGACATTEHVCTPTCCPACCEFQKAAGRTEPVFNGRTEAEWAMAAVAEDGPTRQQVVDALSTIGGSSYCHAVALLKCATPGHRVTGAEVLRRLGKDASGAAPELGQMVRSDPDPLARAAAAHALSAFSEGAASEAGVLDGALDDEIWSVRFHAAVALGGVGWQAFDWRDHLEVVSHRDTDDRVRRVAGAAAEHITDEWIRYQKSLRH